MSSEGCGLYIIRVTAIGPNDSVRVRCLGGGLPPTAAAVAVQPEGRAASASKATVNGGIVDGRRPGRDSMLVSCHPEPASGVLAAPDSPQVTMASFRRRSKLRATRKVFTQSTAGPGRQSRSAKS